MSRCPGRVVRWGLALAWAMIPSAEAFVGVTDAQGVLQHWALNPPDPRVPGSAVNASARTVIYRLDSGGWSKTNTVAELNAIRSAFDQWQAVPGTFLKFQEGPAVSGTQDINSFDDVNKLFWTSKLFVNGGRDNLTGVFALTFVASLAAGSVITDADTVFNGSQFPWFTDSTNPTTQSVHVESIALHEIGHFIGLVHSPVGGATMLAVGDMGVNSQAGLVEDDMLGARTLYGTAATVAASGRISGTVTLSGKPVFGAAVFAETAEGLLRAGTVTESNGVYQLPLLPPGGYTVRTAPLDPLSTANYLVRGADISPAHRGADSEYRPSTNRSVTVTAGGTAKVDFGVVAGSPLRVVRILRPAPDLSSPSFNNKPVSVQPQGQTVYLGVLTPMPLLGSERVTITGDGLTVVGPVETRARVFGSSSLVAVPVRVEASATPGLRSFRLQRGPDFAWAHGFLEVLSPFPDVNFDGLDDRFQRRYWPRFTSAEASPTADPDDDGFANAWEFATGSDPTNRLSAVFEVQSVRVTAAGARVVSRTARGKRFQLHTRDTLPGAEWRPVGVGVTATGDTTEFLDPEATTAVRFYRVQLIP